MSFRYTIVSPPAGTWIILYRMKRFRMGNRVGIDVTPIPGLNYNT